MDTLARPRLDPTLAGVSSDSSVPLSPVQRAGPYLLHVLARRPHGRHGLASQSWCFCDPVGRGSASERSVEQILAAVVAMHAHRPQDSQKRPRLVASVLLGWLEGFDGDSWQQRWHLSGADTAGRGWSTLV